MAEASSIAADVALLEARGLGFDAGGRPLIRQIDLTVAEGRRLMLLGANGAGKSVLMRLLHGLIEPARGEILWRGARAGRRAHAEQAMVFQRPVMLRRSVQANVAFALGTLGLARAERRMRVAEALAHARLDHLAEQPARLLSGGEQQRLAVARALATRPKLLFLDEPTASLDPASTRAIEDLVLDASTDGVTVVMITHDIGQARRLGQDVAFLHAGRVVERGPAEALLDAPRSAPMRAWTEGRLYLETEPDRPGAT